MWEGVGDRTKTAIYWPPLLWPSALYLSRSPDAQPEAQRPTLLGAGFLYSILSPTGLQTPLGVLRAPSAGRWLSLPHLVSDFSGPQLTDFLFSSSYIIVQSPTQSLEWHVWSSSRGNICHAVQRSLSSGASVYECIVGFYLVPFCQPNPPTRFLSITGHWNVSLPSSASPWNGMFSWVEGQYTTHFYLTHRRVNLKIMAMKGYSTFLKLQMHFSVIFRTLVGGGALTSPQRYNSS